PVLQLVRPRALPGEEALEDRLDDVLRIDLAAHPGVQMVTGQRDQTAGIAVENAGGGRLVPRPQPGDQGHERFAGRHGSRAPASRWARSCSSVTAPPEDRKWNLFPVKKPPRFLMYSNGGSSRLGPFGL